MGTCGDPAIGVGVLDTGVDAHHPALRGRVADFLYVDEDGILQPDCSPFDSDGHGTHAAALICGRSVSGQAGVGAAPDARLYCAAVIEHGKVPVRMLLGLEWLARQPIRVVHLPLGIVGKTPLFVESLRRLRRRGVLPVCAVGNGGSMRFETPGCYPEVLSVGACDDEGQPAAFSGSYYAKGTSRCLKPDVLAPGVDVWSAVPGKAWAQYSGTSMASAYVAGIAAWLFTAQPEATPSEVETAIILSARPVVRELAHRCRYGIVDANAALNVLRSGISRRHPPCPPIKWEHEPRCDARLRRQLEFRLLGDELEAIVLLRPGVRSEAALPTLIERHARACRRRYELRLLPGGRGAVISGHFTLLRRLLGDPAVAYLHSTELDVVGWMPG